MGHGEAITSLFVFVLIRLGKCSQGWPGVNTLLPAVLAALCTALHDSSQLFQQQQQQQHNAQSPGKEQHNNYFCQLLDMRMVSAGHQIPT